MDVARLVQPFRIGDGNLLLRPLGHYRLQFLRSHDGAQPAVGNNMTVVSDDTRETNQVLAGGTDGIDAALSLQSLFDRVFGLPGVLAHEVFRASNLRRVVVDVKIAPFLCPALDNNPVKSGKLKKSPEESVCLGSPGQIRRSPFADHGKDPRPDFRAAQRTREEHDPVFRIRPFDARRHFFVEILGAQCRAADVLSQGFAVEDLFAYALVREVNTQYPTHVSTNFTSHCFAPIS